jgi:RNA polymerase sigma factor (sigma-70 family)
MALSHPNPFLHQLRHLLGNVPEAALTDRQLLERFLANHDETAVEVLVRRYGSLVFGVCRRVLHDAHAAEDAFQATFLILLRKAHGLASYERLGGFLYRVAYRVALRARANETRRRQCEAQAARKLSPAEGRTPGPGDLIVALEEELQRLPERHRVPLVLCYLEGKTNEQAAEILGCPRGSISARLSQARERLRACLAHRGFVASATTLATLLAAAAAEAAPPLPLLANTVRAALWFARPEAGAAGFVSSQAVALARGACHAMFVNKLKIAAALMLATVMLGTGATMLLKASPQSSPPITAGEPSPPQGRPDRAEDPAEPLPQGAVARMGSTQLRHGDAVYFAAYSPDSKALVTAGKDRTVRLWDLATGQELRRFAWSEAAQASKAPRFDEGLTQRWEQQLWEDLALGCQAALSPDGKTVAASQGGVVCLWETASGRKLRQLQTGQKRLDQLAFSADGKSLLTLGPGHATAVWDMATGACIRRGDGKPEGGSFRVSLFAATMEQLAFVAPGWQYLAYRRQAENDGPWSIWIKNLATGKEVAQIVTVDGRAPLTFSPDGKTLVWARFEGGIRFCDVAAGKELRRLEGGSAPYDMATNFAFSADGSLLAVSRFSRKIEIWDLKSGKQTGRIAPLSRRPGDEVGAGVCPALAFSPDGARLVASLGGSTIRQFEADTGREIPAPANGHRAWISTLALSVDGRSLWTCGRGDPIRSWDWTTGKETGQRQVPSTATHAAVAGDGRFAYALGNNITLCGADGKKTRQIAVPEVPLTAIALSPEGTILATRSQDYPGIHLWDATTGKRRHTLKPAGEVPTGSGYVVTETTGVVTPDLVFSSDGRFLAGAGPKQLCVWDVTTGNLLWEVPRQPGQAIERFAFSPGGHYLAALNADRTVTLYEVATGEKRGRLGEADPKNRRMHLTFSYIGGEGVMVPRLDAPVCLAISPDGRYLATAQETPAIQLWDVVAGREVGRLKGHEGGFVSLLFAPDGKHLFSGGTDTTALTWNLTRMIRGTNSQTGRSAPVASLEPGALDALWADLAGPDAARAFDAIRRLSASPDQAVMLLKKRLRPATPAEPKRLAQLLADLESDRFELRRQAECALQELGEWTEVALHKVLADDPPLALRRRVERLLDKRLVPIAGPIRELRAVELLELIGSSDAQAVLWALAGGAPGARLTREARDALERLSKQAVTPQDTVSKRGRDS